MPAFNRWRRSLSVALSACMLASATGCRSAEERAIEHSGLVQRGMTRQQVEEVLGDPDSRELQDGVEGAEIWKYSYGLGFDPNSAKILLVAPVLPIALLFVAGMAYVQAHGGRSQEPLLGTWNENESSAVRVYFNPQTGRVRSVTVGR